MKKAAKKKYDWKRALFIFCFLLMPTLNFLIFYVYVNLDSFLMAFQTVEKNTTHWGFDNFIQFYQEVSTNEGIMREALINTFKTFVLTFVMFPLSFLVSLFIYKKIVGANLFRIIFFLPGLISGTVVSSLYIMLCNNTGYGSANEAVGLLSKVVQNLFDLEIPPALLAEERWANAFVLINIIWLGFPGDMIIWGGTLARIPDSVIESARLDGVNWFQEMTKIIIPMVWPTVALKLVLMTTGVFGASGNVFLLTDKGNYGTQTLSNWMYLQIYNQGGYIKNTNVLNYVSAIGLVLTALTAIIVVIVQKITKKFDQEVAF